MIEKVPRFSPWVVPILKPSSNIRVCANYKITVIFILENVNHPLSRIEEILAALKGGREFSKLDFCQALNH